MRKSRRKLHLLRAKDRWYAEQRLRRMVRRLDKTRGRVMNLSWLNAMADFTEFHGEVCGLDDGSCSHG